MKRPYFLEKSLPDRVQTYMLQNKRIIMEDMTQFLINNYREFRGKNLKTFSKSVQKAYEWNIYLKKHENGDSSGSEDIYDHDGGDDDIMEIIEPEPPLQAHSLNATLNKMYRSSPCNSTPIRPVTKSEDVFFLDTDGTNVDSGTSTPMPKSERKRRKKDATASGAVDFDNIIKRKKKRQLLPEENGINFSQMAGMETLKDKICDLLANLRWPGVLKPVHKSVLITGPTGSGKTSFARALAGTAEVALFRVSSTELVGGLSGESEERIKETFDQALSLSPCVLLIERIDAISSKGGNGKAMERRIGAQLVACLSSLKSHHVDKQVLVLGETTQPESLDWDVRSGFDDEIFMSIPTEATRGEMLQVLCSELSNTFDFAELSHRTPGYVAGDLKKLVEKAQCLAWRRKRKTLYSQSGEPSLLEQLQHFMKEFSHMAAAEGEKGEDVASPVNMEDFMEALTMVTPALKREGFPTVPEVTWDDVGGLIEVKKELREKILEPIKYAKLHSEFGASRPNGILMWGPPGCGKTLLAKAVANEAGINLLPIMGPELLNMYQGESERAVREVFNRAVNVAPCIIFFDEFDALCPVRTKGGESGSKTTVVNTLLTEMNGFAVRENVYVVAATNRPDMLDPAVTRPGRFDTLLYVDLPDSEGRVGIFLARTKNGTCPKLSEDVDLKELARLCENFSGADCDQLIYLASKEAIREVLQASAGEVDGWSGSTERVVSRHHFAAALRRIKPSVSTEEQRRYRKLHFKMESRFQTTDLGTFEETVDNATDVCSSSTLISKS